MGLGRERRGTYKTVNWAAGEVPVQETTLSLSEIWRITEQVRGDMNKVGAKKKKKVDFDQQIDHHLQRQAQHYTHPEDLAGRGSNGELSGSRAKESEREGGEQGEHVDRCRRVG